MKIVKKNKVVFSTFDGHLCDEGIGRAYVGNAVRFLAEVFHVIVDV